MVMPKDRLLNRLRQCYYVVEGARGYCYWMYSGNRFISLHEARMRVHDIVLNFGEEALGPGAAIYEYRAHISGAKARKWYQSLTPMRPVRKWPLCPLSSALSNRYVITTARWWF